MPLLEVIIMDNVCFKIWIEFAGRPHFQETQQLHFHRVPYSDICIPLKARNCRVSGIRKEWKCIRGRGRGRSCSNFQLFLFALLLCNGLGIQKKNPKMCTAVNLLRY